MFKTYCRSLYKSFYDAETYRQAIDIWNGVGGLYLLILSSLMALVLTVFLGMGLYQFNHTELPYMLKQMPTIEIKDNTIVNKFEKPVMVTNSDKSIHIYIDTETNLQTLTETGYEIIIGKQIMLFKQADGYRPVALKGIKSFVLTPGKIQEAFNSILPYFILIWPFFSIGQFINCIVSVFIVAVLSYGVTAALREEYDFKTRMRVAALASTPPILITKIIMILLAHEPAIWFEVLLGLLYFYVMIVLMRRIKKEN